MEFHIKKLIAFSDNEISNFQILLNEWVINNLETLSKEDCITLTMLSNELQSQMRWLKHRLNKELEKYHIESNNYFILTLQKYPGAIDYIRNEYLKAFEDISDDDKFKHFCDNTYHSYFKLSDNSILESEQNCQTFLEKEIHYAKN